MKCPECGTEDAYIGMHNIDCLNSSCKFFQGDPNTVVSTPTPVAPTPPQAAPTPPPPQPSPINWPVGNVGSVGTIGGNIPGAQGATGVVAPPVTVNIVKATKKINSVEITFKAFGDPGNPTRTVEFFWTLPNNPSKAVCTLSNRSRYFVSGVDADGQTTYTTHWQCQLDGVQPTDPWLLEATIT